MRDAFARAISDLARTRDDLWLVTADISPASVMAEAANSGGLRVTDAGVAEQAMIGLAAGLAMQGFRPFAYSIANFSVYRPYEHIRVDVSYQELPVVIVGVGAGLSYSALGPTHHTIEDIALFGSMPNMTIFTPCDPLEVRGCVTSALQLDGPSYIRLGKSGEPTLTEDVELEFSPGRCRQIQAGDETAVISYGPLVGWLDQLRQRALDQGDSAFALYSCTTVDPLPRADILGIFDDYERVVVVEEHVEHGGLADLVLKLAFENGIDANRYRGLGLNEAYAHAFGSQGFVRAAYGLSDERVYGSLLRKG